MNYQIKSYLYTNKLKRDKKLKHHANVTILKLIIVIINFLGLFLNINLFDQVSPAKRLRGGVIFVEEIPKNPSGKILRKELRKLLAANIHSKL